MSLCKKSIFFLSLILSDARNFGTLKCCFDDNDLDKKLRNLGFDWLNPSSRPTFEQFLQLGNMAATRKRPLAVFLMDQKKTAGIGNYILAEVLYKSRIHPDANCKDMTIDLWNSLYLNIQDIILRSYNSQSISGKAL